MILIFAAGWHPESSGGKFDTGRGMAKNEKGRISGAKCQVRRTEMRFPGSPRVRFFNHAKSVDGAGAVCYTERFYFLFSRKEFFKRC